MTGSTFTRLAPTTVALEFSITSQEIADAEYRAYHRLVKNVRMPGFRKGKVPRKIFEQAYGSETVVTQAVDDVVPEVYARAIREHNLDPVERPKVEILEESDGRPTRVRATVEVRPEIQLGTYKGLTVERPPVAVTDADIDRSLEALARERATLVPVSRPARLGDVATLDYEGTIGGVPFEGGSATGETIELREGRFVPGFVDGIIGMNPGERRSIEVRFPDEYPSEEVAGKDASFAIALHELKEFDLPPIDDEFARTISGNQTLGELREDLRKRLESVALTRSRRVIGNIIVDKLMASHDFPLPPSMVDAEIDRLMEDEGKSDPEVREGYRSQAESRVKATLLMEHIGKVEKIVATPADLAGELEALARRYGQPPARIRKALGNNLLSLMDGIVRNKTLDLLVDSAVIIDSQESSPPAS